jgi:hypothetical protein
VGAAAAYLIHPKANVPPNSAVVGAGAENHRLMHEPGTVPPLRRHRASVRINPCIYLPPENQPSAGFMLNRTFGSAATGPPTPLPSAPSLHEKLPSCWP